MVQDVNLDNIWRCVLSLHGGGTHSSIHGFAHWARVERNGRYIAERTEANGTVISLFALFHDIRRENDGIDPGHGQRGAAYAKSLRHDLDVLSDEDFDRLLFACTHHTDQLTHDDPTIGACWDADRLDLERVGFILSEKFFSTEPAIDVVRKGDLLALESKPLRTI